MRTNDTSHLGSILDVIMIYVSCGWEGIVWDCEPDVDGEGSLGCPKCLNVVKEKYEITY